MSKYLGSRAKVYAGGYDLSGSTSSLDADSTIEAADVTTFGATAKEFIGGVQMGKIKQKTFYDDSAGAIEPMIAAFRGTAGAVATFYPGGDALGSPGYASAVAEMLDTATIASPVGGATTLEADWTVSGGLEDVISVLPQTAFLGTGSRTAEGAVQDNGTLTTNGGSVYFHLLALDAGASVAGWVYEHSADQVTWVTLLTCTLAGGVPGAVRQVIAPGTTIQRYTVTNAIVTSGKHATLAVAAHRG